MTIEDFLKILQDRDLVPRAIVEQVRAKVEQGDRRITPKSLLKYLVKKEHLTKRQAKSLLETTLTVTPKAESSILGMVPMPRLPSETDQDSKPEVKQTEAIPTITPASDSHSSLVTSEGSGFGADLFDEKPESLLSDSLSQIATGEDPALEESSLKPKGSEAKKKSRKKKKKKNEWDSNLLLLGGGGLILLLITGVIIFYLLTRENADAVLAEASEYYEGGSYTQAIKQYDRFIENHQSHPDHSAAKVRVGLARLWKASSSTSNFTPALNVARDVLPSIGDEESFGTGAQQELSSLLPEIAKGLANQAEKAADNEKAQQFVKMANEALAFCANTKYIPKRFRDDLQIGQIDQTLQRVERAREQQAALSSTLAQMQQAIDNRETASAYRLHEQLLDEHPGLLNNQELAQKILEISNAESAVVEFIKETRPASTAVIPSPVVAELALANRTGPTGIGNGAVAVRVSGAAYGINLSDGAVLWRRYVGLASDLAPVNLENGELLVVDDRANDLLKLSSQDGKLIWRQSFESSVSRPIVVGDQILINELSGRTHVLDLRSGQSEGYVQFAQEIASSPAVDSQGKHIYVIGAHSSLYTISSTDYSCLGVFFLGHAKQSVRTPAINVLNKVAVVVSKGLSTSELQVLGTNAEGIPTQRAASKRLSGVVSSDLLSQGRRLVVVTSSGQVVAYEVGSGNGDSAITQIAQRERESGDLVARYGLMNQGHVWVAGPKLNKLAVLPTSDRLAVTNIDQDYAGDFFDHPLIASGELLIHVRRPDGQAGAIVSAMNLKSGEAQWSTEIAASPAGPAAVSAAGGKIGAVTSTSVAYLVDRQAMRERVLNTANTLRSRRNLTPFNRGLDLGAGSIVASAKGADKLLYFQPGNSRNALQSIRLVSNLSCEPVLWEDGFVVPTQVGQVFLFNSEDSKQWGAPFQPPLQPGEEYHWLTPATYAAGENSLLVLSDGNKRIYLLGRVAKPQPHLTALESSDISTAPLNTRLAVVGDLAIAGAKDGSLSVFQLPVLAPAESVQINANVTWGPYTIGKNVLLATSSEEIVCLDSQAKITWRKSLAHGPPAGQPTIYQEGIELIWQRGGISRISLADGQESSFTPLPQPVVAGPVPFGKRLVVSAYDGTLLILNHPE